MKGRRKLTQHLYKIFQQRYEADLGHSNNGNKNGNMNNIILLNQFGRHRRKGIHALHRHIRRQPLFGWTLRKTDVKPIQLSRRRQLTGEIDEPDPDYPSRQPIGFNQSRAFFLRERWRERESRSPCPCAHIGNLQTLFFKGNTWM